MFSLIVAMDSRGGIGKDGGLPWNAPEDMAHFKKITSESPTGKENVVVMGRNTWNSIPERYRPLKNRKNIVLSRTVASVSDDMVTVLNCIDDVFNYVDTNKKVINKVFIIGGANIYNAFLKPSRCLISDIYLTRLYKHYNCDTFFDTQCLENYRLLSETTRPDMVFQRYSYINKDEESYLALMRTILETGDTRQDRTKVGTKSKFGCVLKWDLSDGVMPILTTKRTFYRGIAEELLWFLSGSTDARKLQERGVGIWNGNSSREFLDSRGLQRLPEGDIGAGYGFQLRHFGADYINCETDYTGKGFDQLQNVIDLIKTDPHSRRILFSYWNPAAHDSTALPPCHLMYQFYVDTDAKTLSCNLYQRSSDFFLANNFNVVSAVILMHLIGHLTGLTPKTLTHMMGDTHIYSNHFEQCKKQLSRMPTPFPKFRVVPKKDIKTIGDFTIEDLELICYFPKPGIKAEMAV